MKKKLSILAFVFLSFFFILQLGNPLYLQVDSQELPLGSASSSVYQARVNDTLTWKVVQDDILGFTEDDLWKMEVLTLNDSEVISTSLNVASGEVMWVNKYLKNTTSLDFVFNGSDWHLVHNETHENLTDYDSMMSNRGIVLPVSFGGKTLNQTINSTYYNMINEHSIPLNNSIFNSTTKVTFWDGLESGEGIDDGDIKVFIDFNETTFETINVSLFVWGGLNGKDWYLNVRFELVDKNFTQISLDEPRITPIPDPLVGLIIFGVILGITIPTTSVIGIIAIRYFMVSRIPTEIKLSHEKDYTVVKVIKKAKD